MKRFGWVFATLVVAMWAAADAVWAAKCLDDCCGRCARRARCRVERVRCCASTCAGCCEPTSCVPAPCDRAGPAPAKVVPKPAPAPVLPPPPKVEKPYIEPPKPAPAPPKPVEPPKPAPPAKVMLPAERPAETPPPPPKPSEAKKAEPPAKPAEPKKPEAAPKPPEPKKTEEKKPEEKKAEAPAKKVSWADRRLRVWTDSTGKHRVVARFVTTLDDGCVVRLQRIDGSYVRVALERLSSDDRGYVLDGTFALASAW